MKFYSSRGNGRYQNHIVKTVFWDDLRKPEEVAAKPEPGLVVHTIMNIQFEHGVEEYLLHKRTSEANKFTMVSDDELETIRNLTEADFALFDRESQTKSLFEYCSGDHYYMHHTDEISIGEEIVAKHNQSGIVFQESKFRDNLGA